MVIQSTHDHALVLSNALTSDVTSVRLHELMMIDLALSRLISSVLGIRIVTTTARLMIEVDLGWHVEGFVLLRIAYRYGSTRLARLHWSGTGLFAQFLVPIDLKLA